MKRSIFFLAGIFAGLFVTAQNGSEKLKTGEVFRDCPDCPEMVVIPGGSFLMGSTEKELSNSKYAQFQRQTETPVHRETIRSFAAGKFNISKAQWATFVKASNRPDLGACSWGFLPEDSLKPWVPNRAANWNHLGFFQDSTHPAVCISWDDAQDYIKWMNKKTKGSYRLLTEAEWEYAARAGSQTAFPWGDSATHDYANYGTDTTAGLGLATGKDKWVETSPEGSFPPNQFGLYDMNGNILQWVEDCLSVNYHDYPTDGSAYKSNDSLHFKADIWAAMNGKPACFYRICRGGDAWDNPPLIRSASRNWGEVTGHPATNYSSAGLGFRLAKSF